MAESVHLFLKAHGKEVKGESTQHSHGREHSIECVYYEQEVSSARDAGSGMATGRRQYEPLLIRKRIDKSTPLLMKALTENQEVEGQFKFFRPNPKGDGTTQHFYTVHFKHGRINTIKQYLPHSTSPVESTEPMLEEISFVFGQISWHIEHGGSTHEDSWAKPK